jgi:murein DD-endopeptidase MepM/ murein hydrolase activator NlpD
MQGERIDSQPENTTDDNKPSKPPLSWSQIWEGLVRLGLGEVTLRIGTGLASFVLVLLVVWVMGNFYLKSQVTPSGELVMAAPLPTPTATLPSPQVMISQKNWAGGITRLVVPHTILPARPRFEVVQYLVQKGDTVIGIAQKYGLKPETILWGNYYILADNPDRLLPGQKLNILPVDGMYYEWHAGDGLNGVAKFYGVTTDEIVNWPGNHLDVKSLGDFAHPNIKTGTWIMIPGGHRDFIVWSAPRITRDNPAVAKIFGAGFCGKVNDGPIGTGTFIWPSTEKYLSGYDFSPETNHWGIDIAGKLGNPVYAADNGVVVYAGWNDWGYGNVVVIDHGNGWQTLYAHLSVVGVQCGAYVYQGSTIAQMGSTGASSGPHLHFEMLSDKYGRANPWNFLQK